MDRFTAALESALTYIVTGVLGGIVWLVRRVLTNERKIALLEADLKHREALRREDREAMKEVKQDVRDIKAALLKRD